MKNSLGAVATSLGKQAKRIIIMAAIAGTIFTSPSFGQEQVPTKRDDREQKRADHKNEKLDDTQHKLDKKQDKMDKKNRKMHKKHRRVDAQQRSVDQQTQPKS
jgi:uncharacterized protein HemX